MPASKKVLPPDTRANPRRPLKNARSMELYRAVHGQRLRQYASIGDPLRDRDAVGNRWRFFILLGLAVGTVLLIYLIFRRM